MSLPETLDQVPIGDEQVTEVLAETKKAFAFNQSAVEDLARRS